jgi:hypothetical protein
VLRGCDMRNVENCAIASLVEPEKLEVGCNVVGEERTPVAAVESGEEALAVSVCVAGGLFLELKSNNGSVVSLSAGSGFGLR